MCSRPVRQVAIVADGSTDYQILRCLIDASLGAADSGRHQNRFLQLEGLSLRDDVDRFWLDASHSDEYALHEPASMKLQNAVLDVLLTAINQFQEAIDRPLSDNDLLLLNTDAESYLTQSGAYFDEPWAVALNRSVDHAIERFYHLKSARDHVPMEYAPMVLPLIFFPSTDILIAAVRPDLSGDFRGRRARDIKKAVYEVDNLRQLNEEEFELMALTHISPDVCSHVYQHLPEARSFLRTLKWNTALVRPA